VLSTSARDLLASDVTPWLDRRLREFFLSRASAQQVDTFIHKLTGWPRIGFLDQIFPEARFIHVIRDGRAVANSWLQMPWWLGYGGPERWQWGPLGPELAAEWEQSGHSFAVLAGLLWALLVDAFDAAASPLPKGRWLEVRYEDVTARPRQAFEAMLEFCDLPWDGGFERGFRRHRFERGRAEPSAATSRAPRWTVSPASSPAALTLTDTPPNADLARRRMRPVSYELATVNLTSGVLPELPLVSTARAVAV